ncbi:MAG: hypothetical protein ABIK44_08200 [candidate division WOR-3 bacterium]
MNCKLFTALFLVFAGLYTIGCDQGFKPPARDPEYREPMVNGYLYKVQYYDYSVGYETYIEVSDNEGLRMVPLVLLNGETIPIFYYSPTRYRYGHENPFPVYARYELEVYHYWGRAFSNVVMPGNFTVTRPMDNYILDLESTLVITWGRSTAAQWYWLELIVDYDFLDSSGAWDSYELQIDTMIQDTVISLRPYRIFPRSVMDVLEGDGLAMVWSGNGPAVEPGDMSNVRGNGFGFFNAINEPRERYFYVGAPPLCRRCPQGSEIRARMLERLRNRLKNE